MKTPIYIINGTKYTQMTIDLLKRADLASLIGDRNKKVGIKPNLVVAKQASSGATSHPEIIAGILDYLKAEGFTNVEVLEGSWVGDRTSSAFRVSGIADVCEERKIPYYDLQKDSSQTVNAHGMDLKVCSRALALDFLVQVPVLKGHCQFPLTCALKNHKGLIPDSEKRRYHTLGVAKPVGYVSTVFPNQFVVCDNICGDLDFEEGGNPVVMNRIIGCSDPVLMDAYGCSVMGCELDEVPYIKLAERLGVGSANLDDAEIININQPKAQLPKHQSGVVRKLAQYANADEACSACYGSLIHALKKLNDEGYLRRLPQGSVCIGQGFKGKEGKLGVGSCTSCFAHSLAGCPPTSSQMVEFLKKQLQ